MRFKDFLKESIIDIPRKTYARPVFDNADTSNPTLKPSVQKQILDGIQTFTKFGKVVKYTLIGSILTKQYRDDADLDINILFDIPGSKEEQEKVHDQIREYQGEINGRTVTGSNHPINYFSIIDPATFSKAREMADGTFDIDKNKFIRKPEPGTFEPEKYVADFQKAVSEIDVVKGELVRDMIDYEELKNLTDDQIENLSSLVSKKLDEIKSSINTLIDIGDKTIADRKDAFSADMSPEEIRKFGVKNRLPKNVIYKMLEKYHYLKFFKKLNEIMEDGKISPDELKSLSKIKEARGKSIVFTFGRFNPPTIGHGKLLDKMNSVRADVKRVYLSKSEDSDKNPLKFRQKIALMKRMFPRYANQIVTSNSNQIFEIATELYRQNFTEIFMVVGSDRVREFETTLNKYNNVRARHGYYNFDNINVLSAGERDPDAEGATGMSASKMRAAAKTNNFTKFKQGLPSSFARTKDAEDMFKQVRKGMNLAASYGYDGGAGALRFKPFITASTKEELDNMVLRDKYITEHLYDVGDIVDDVSNNTTGIIIRRGTNYVTLEDADMKLSKAWLYDIVETPVVTDAMAERAKKIAKHKYKRDPKYYDKGGSIKKSPEDKETGLPKKYVKGLSKDKAKQHKAQLDRQSKMRDDDPAAYRQTTADKGAKTKPSKYTKKFKQMYGELKTSKDTDPTLMPTGVPEAYDMGHDYAKYTSSITPGEKHYSASFQGTTYKPSNPKDNLINVNAEKDNEMKKKVELKDIEEWANDKDTIDKYKERYGEDWQSKIEETYEKMFSKVIDSNENMLEGRMKDIAIDLMSKEKGGLDADEFKRKYNKSKAEMQKDLGTPPNMPKKSFKEFAEDVNEWGVFPSMIVEAEYQGKKVKLNDPIRTSENPNKKFKVYVKDGDTVKVVRFGDPNMSIKRDDPARLKNFRARHNCDNPGPKTKARYWSCFQWRAGAKVDN
jgi:phosphopantetheine adenylyltransferase